MIHKINKNQLNLLKQIKDGKHLYDEDGIYRLAGDYEISKPITRHLVEFLIEKRLIEFTEDRGYILTHDGRETVEAS